MPVVPGQVEDIELADVNRWCHLHLGTQVADELFHVGYLSTVIGIRLTSGQSIVVKVRRPAERLIACWTVHRHLFDCGFPCPEPLVGPEPLRDHVASAEALVLGGELFPTSGRAAAPFAESLAHLIALSPNPDELPTLDPSPPWTAWNHREPGLWPWPDDRDFDLNALDGPGWLDHAAQAARERLQRSSPERVVGHGDWYTGNLRWNGQQLHVAYDWDSIMADTEPIVVGLAAAVFPVHACRHRSHHRRDTSLHRRLRNRAGRPFSRAQIEECWAAGLWSRSFDAKKQFATEGQSRSLGEDEARERLRRAGAG